MGWWITEEIAKSGWNILFRYLHIYIAIDIGKFLLNGVQTNFDITFPIYEIKILQHENEMQLIRFLLI